MYHYGNIYACCGRRNFRQSIIAKSEPFVKRQFGYNLVTCLLVEIAAACVSLAMSIDLEQLVIQTVFSVNYQKKE